MLGRPLSSSLTKGIWSTTEPGFAFPFRPDVSYHRAIQVCRYLAMVKPANPQFLVDSSTEEKNELLMRSARSWLMWLIEHAANEHIKPVPELRVHSNM
jgi:hypothetical protein